MRMSHVVLELFLAAKTAQLRVAEGKQQQQRKQPALNDSGMLTFVAALLNSSMEIQEMLVAKAKKKKKKCEVIDVDADFAAFSRTHFQQLVKCLMAEGSQADEKSPAESILKVVLRANKQKAVSTLWQHTKISMASKTPEHFARGLRLMGLMMSLETQLYEGVMWDFNELMKNIKDRKRSMLVCVKFLIYVRSQNPEMNNVLFDGGQGGMGTWINGWLRVHARSLRVSMGPNEVDTSTFMNTGNGGIMKCWNALAGK
jgi:hypothetical protein